ncbi:hypothetical protein C7M84_012577 [Penaeus vannamei]|uniref:Gustatory receptor n=1 Tax=Penaeus vannamei TaxID=6689 RepID=A0A3R7PK73_PENVA|nr:hypothetical protein C7M84_012577 [Penaeus vannamei]
MEIGFEGELSLLLYARRISSSPSEGDENTRRLSLSAARVGAEGASLCRSSPSLQKEQKEPRFASPLCRRSRRSLALPYPRTPSLLLVCFLAIVGMKCQIPSLLRRLSWGQQGCKWVICFCVWSLQLVGSFPYTWPGPPYQPRFSLWLCAWCVFMKIYCLFGVYVLFQVGGISLSDWTGSDLHGIIYKVSLMVYLCAYSQPHLVLLAKSRKLASILSRFAPFEEPVSQRRGVSPLILLQVLLLDFLIPAVALTFPSVPLLGHRLVMVLFAVLGGHSCFSAYLLFKALSVALSAYLVDAVEETLSPTLSEEGVSASLALPSLLLLEKRIRKVDETRRDLASCFFEGTSAVLLASVVGVIGSLFRFLVFGNQTDVYLQILMMNSYAIAGLCEVGQHFEDRIYRLLGFLEPLRKFNMCGWFTMNKTLFLSMGSVVLAYLVVLLQIGNQVSAGTL